MAQKRMVRWLLIGGLLLAAAVGAGATLYRASGQQAAGQQAAGQQAAGQQTNLPDFQRPAAERRAAAPLAEAAAAFEEALRRDAANQEAVRLLAQTQRMQGQEEAALATWQRAAAANPQARWAWQGVAEMAQDMRNAAVAAEALAALAALPGDAAAGNPQAAEEMVRLQHAAARRQRVQEYWAAAGRDAGALSFTPVDQRLDDQWTMVGYFADTEALLRGERSEVWVAWATEAASAAPVDDEAWEQIDAGLWLQNAGTSTNLLGDGTFDREGEVGATNIFPNDLYGADPGTRQVRSVVRGGEETLAAVLANGLGNPHTSYVSQPLAVTGGTVYLQSGALRSVGGNAFLGRRWRLADGTVAEEYLVTSEAGGVWREAAQVAKAPAGATAVEVLLLNRSTTGTAYFDDLLLLPIAPPSATVE